MGGRQRRGSAAQEENQKQEAQLFYEEANCHIKAGNIEKAVGSYTKVNYLNLKVQIQFSFKIIKFLHYKDVLSMCLY